jgi:hypothetical protein
LAAESIFPQPWEEGREEDKRARKTGGLAKLFLCFSFAAGLALGSQAGKMINSAFEPPALHKKVEVPECPRPPSCHNSGYIGGSAAFLKSLLESSLGFLD